MYLITEITTTKLTFLNRLQRQSTYPYPWIAKFLSGVYILLLSLYFPLTFSVVQSQLGFLLSYSNEMAPVKLCSPSVSSLNRCS